MSLRWPYRVLLLLLLVFIAASLNGCLINYMVDAVLLENMAVKWNAVIGTTKDERIKVIGPPDRCVPLSAGGEVCEWSTHGVSTRGSWENHVLYTYDRNGIATEWNYWGDLGQRSSKDYQTRQAMKETRPADSPPQDNLRSSLGASVDKRDRASDDMSPTKIRTLQNASAIRQSPREITFIGFPLDEGASRQQIQDAILNRGGKLLSQLHSPETDEFDSSSWIEGSEKTAVFYTKTGQLVGLAISWPVADLQRGLGLVMQLQAKLTNEFGPTTHDDIGQGGWPLVHQWKTMPVIATLSGEGKDSPIVLGRFAFPERLAVFASELANKGNGRLY